MKNRSLLLVVMIALFVLVPFSFAWKGSTQSISTEQAFIQKAAEINLGEVELGKLAEQKGNNPAIKDFGKRMIQDHTQAENELQALAKQEGVTLPTGPEPKKGLRQELSSASGVQFDHTYIQHMLAGHKDAIDAFEKEVEHGQNPATNAYAEKMLPIIQDHVRIAENVAGKMGMSGKQGLDQEMKATTASASPR